MSASHVSRAIVQSKEMGNRFVAREGPRPWPRRLEITQKDPRPTGKAHPVFDPLDDAATNTRARWRGKPCRFVRRGVTPGFSPTVSQLDYQVVPILRGAVQCPIRLQGQQVARLAGARSKCAVFVLPSMDCRPYPWGALAFVSACKWFPRLGKPFACFRFTLYPLVT